MKCTVNLRFQQVWTINSIILEEKKLETQYVNKEILYEEYKSRKQQLEIQKIVLRDNILILEKEYGVDDTYEN